MRRFIAMLGIGAALAFAAPAQASKAVRYHPKPVPKWRLTPTPHRPLQPSCGGRYPDRPCLGSVGSPGQPCVCDAGAMYMQPGPFILYRGKYATTLRRSASDWYPVGSYIDLRMPPHSRFAAEGTQRIKRDGDETPTCVWRNPVVASPLTARPVRQYVRGDGSWIEWRVRATNRGNEVVTQTLPNNGGVSLEYWQNYSNAYVKVTIRCVPVGPQLSLVDIGGGVVAGVS